MRKVSLPLLALLMLIPICLNAWFLWENIGLGEKKVVALAVDKKGGLRGTLYAVTGEGEVYMRPNGSMDWLKVYSPEEPQPRFAKDIVLLRPANANSPSRVCIVVSRRGGSPSSILIGTPEEVPWHMNWATAFAVEDNLNALSVCAGGWAGWEHIYAGSGRKLYYSSDPPGGNYNNWQGIELPGGCFGTVSPICTDVLALPLGGDAIGVYTCGYDTSPAEGGKGGVVRDNTLIGKFDATCLAFFEQRLWRLWVGSLLRPGFSNGGVYYYQPEATPKWKLIGLENKDIRDILAPVIQPDIVIVATNDGVYAPRGESLGLEGISVFCLSSLEDKYYAGTSVGVFVGRREALPINKEAEVKLKKVSPLSYNPWDTFSLSPSWFEMPETKIKIYNILGQLVGELKLGVSNQIFSPGRKLSSGVYFYELEGKGRVVRKGLVVK